jgi:hypothetical protein
MNAQELTDTARTLVAGDKGTYLKQQLKDKLRKAISLDVADAVHFRETFAVE